MRRSLQFAAILLTLSFAATTLCAQTRGTSSSNASGTSGGHHGGGTGGTSHFSGRTLSTQPSPGYVSPFHQEIHLPGGGAGCYNCGYGVYGGYVYSGYEGNYYNGVGPSATDRILANGGTFNNINDTSADQQQSAPQQQPIYIRPEYPTNYATDNSTVNTPLQNPTASASSDSPALLIFKDGTKLTIRNYAIYGANIVVLTPERRKFPIAALDVAATQKANEEAGYEFKIPAVFTSH
jgi:hypothetical protein